MFMVDISNPKLHPCALSDFSFEETRLTNYFNSTIMSGNDNLNSSNEQQSMPNFSFFDGKDVPKLPTVPGK